ncbi:cation transporter [Clostridium sp. AF15-17LB]|nr:cation transporter [Clostridium sp. AF15-17LB]
MNIDLHRQKHEKSALKISLAGGTVFVILEFIMAVYTSSQAVLLDALYDGVELLMIFFSLFLVPLLYQPSSEKRPFGYMQIESLFMAVKGTIMASVTVGLIVNNIQIMLHGGRHVSFSTIAYFELFAFVLSVAVIVLLRRMNARLSSPIVSMEIQEWRIDAAASLGMTFAFFLPAVITSDSFAAVTPYLDQIIAVVLSLFMLPVPVRTVITGLRDLFLLPPEEETVCRIKEIITPVLDAYGYDRLYFDIVRTGRKLWISVYITFDRDEISISRFKIVQNLINQALAKEYQDFYFELLPDIENAEDRGHGV